MNIFTKPYYQYSLIDTLIIAGLFIVAMLSYYGIRLAILGIKLYLSRRRNK